MFGVSLTFANFPSPAPEDDKPLLPATPTVFPACQPRVADDDDAEAASRITGAGAEPASLVDFLQGIVRPPEISLAHLQALGVHVTTDVGPEILLPDPSYFPDFAAWDRLTPDEARAQNNDTRRPLNNGGQSPGCQIYLDRVRELSTSNEDAFRTVRRIPPPPGKQQARLGNSYEFFRCLEMFTPFWDDTTAPPRERPPRADGPPEGYYDDAPASLPSRLLSPLRPGDPRGPNAPNYWQLGIGAAMSNISRQNAVSAFLKLVAYDFGCNVTPARTEPRLQLTSPPSRKQRGYPPSQRSSYFASGCTFLFRSPTTREAARAGIVEGPLAAVSARGTTEFEKEEEQLIDLARELIAGLLTAQHRAREGKEEVRFGEGQWWTTAKRWGGGPGGPIGREIDVNDIPGDKDEASPTATSPGGDGAAGAGAGAIPAGLPLPVKKKPRKGLSMYDNYRIVRPPSFSWDKKARYEAIGRPKGVPYDDIFVVSSLFHHVSFVRVRVPKRLLEVLDGAPEDGRPRSWGKLEVVRSRWFDFYKVEDRVAAAQMVWGMMAYLMRKEVGDAPTGGDGDVKMADA